MSRRTLNLDDRLYDYVLDASLREHPALAELREATRKHPHAGMQISPEQGQLLALLVKLIGARRTIEVGVFTGYSALAVALALPAGGRVLACDVSDEYTRIGKPYWQRAGVADKIDLVLEPALTTLDARLAAGEAGRYDFAFIDADKTNYDGYYERCLRLLRSGGLIAIDNTLWSGRVAQVTGIEFPVALAAVVAHQADQRPHHGEGADLDPPDHQRQQADRPFEAVHGHDLGVCHAGRPADLHVSQRDGELGEEIELRLAAQRYVASRPGGDLLADPGLQGFAGKQHDDQHEERRGRQEACRQDPCDALHSRGFLPRAGPAIEVARGEGKGGRLAAGRACGNP